MPRPKLTPEERQARKKANALRWYYKNREAENARALARYHATIAAMTPEELDVFRTQQNEKNHRLRTNPTPEQLESKRASGRRYHHRNREILVPKMRTRHTTRRATMTPEELLAELERRNANQKRYYATHPLEVKERKTIRGVKSPLRKLVIAAAKGVCLYCTHYNPTCRLCPKGTHKLTVDHITAVTKGGKSTLHNLVACCRSCNARKKISPAPLLVQPLLL